MVDAYQSQLSKGTAHYMQDPASCLTPILQGSRIFLEMRWLNFLVIRVRHVSRPSALKSWILKKSRD